MKIENLKLKICFFGTPDFVVPVLECLNESFAVIGVVSTPDQLTGRKQILTPTPVKKAAEKLDIPVLTPKQLNNLSSEALAKEDEAMQQLGDLNSDLFVVASYGKIIPQEILNIPHHGSLNIHPSLLPKYRGPSPIQTQILDDVTESGITIIQMDAEIDHGPIVAQQPFTISSDDTFEILAKKMFAKTAETLPEVIHQYVSGDLILQEQNHSEATFTQHITKQDGYFDSNNPPSQELFDRMKRAYFPWPAAWTKLQMAKGKEQIVKFLPEKKIQVEGGRPMKIKDFLNGYPKVRPLVARLGFLL